MERETEKEERLSGDQGEARQPRITRFPTAPTPTQLDGHDSLHEHVESSTNNTETDQYDKQDSNTKPFIYIIVGLHCNLIY